MWSTITPMWCYKNQHLVQMSNTFSFGIEMIFERRNKPHCANNGLLSRQHSWEKVFIIWDDFLEDKIYLKLTLKFNVRQKLAAILIYFNLRTLPEHTDEALVTPVVLLFCAMDIITILFSSCYIIHNSRDVYGESQEMTDKQQNIKK